MESIGDRLKHARLAKNMTQDMLVDALEKVDPELNVTRMNISHLENNIISSMKERMFLASTKVLSCNPDWLALGEGDMTVKEPSATYNANVSQVAADAVLCPIVSWVQAGNFAEVQLPYTPDEYKYMPCPEPTGHGTYILKIKLDSMTPKFEENDLIFVDPNQVSAEHDKYVIALLTDSTEVTFKQLQIIDGKKYLRALNPNYPPELRFLPINGNCQIIGTVVAHLKPL
ncbi:phage repressor protein [Vibrio albus]|uniref:Phage repressor protein n=1 Tax=Vibrio albus TaxID=2200953 RepID=A0A2U3BDQ0_9VIBR|nr:XRE family transcriptional regulator [Vibrio albus]PWI34864.1 phage repressor protein [Vibrio albus]